MISSYSIPLGCCSCRKSESLSGLEIFNFAGHWRVIKDNISQLRELPYKVTLRLQVLGKARANMLAKNMTAQVSSLQSDIDKANKDLQQAWKVREIIDKYMPEWVKGSRGTVVSQLGALPIILGAAAIAGLAFVAVEGMKLLKEYQFEKSVIAQITAKGLSVDEATKLLESEKQKGLFSGLFGGMNPIAIVGIVVGLGFIFMGMRK